MFGRRKRVDENRKVAGLLAEFLGHQVETEQMKAAARSSQRSVAILKPQIPIGVGSSAGWFGGNAAMPPGTSWPERDGKKLLFVGQIDLSVLPRDLWSGIGPRSGWLGIFLPAQGAPKPTVLHFNGPVAGVEAPPPNDADWTRIHNFREPRTYELPKWPLIVETRPGHELHGDSTSTPTRADQRNTLLDSAYHPFDRETLSLLLIALSEAVTRLASEIVRFPAMKKLHPADAAWFERKRPAMLETFVRFFEIEGRMRSWAGFDPAAIAGSIGELAELDAYRMKYLSDDGYAELVLEETKLLDWQPSNSELRFWWERYEAALISHAIKTYVSSPARLPKALRERLEAEWRSQTQDGLALMGHAPRGHIYTPHGPNSPNEVLIEICTSRIAGFIWGDCNSIVLTIDRKALRRGDFRKVGFDITN